MFGLTLEKVDALVATVGGGESHAQTRQSAEIAGVGVAIYVDGQLKEAISHQFGEL